MATTPGAVVARSERKARSQDQHDGTLIVESLLWLHKRGAAILVAWHEQHSTSQWPAAPGFGTLCFRTFSLYFLYGLLPVFLVASSRMPSRSQIS